jgi:hypothetical protein
MLSRVLVAGCNIHYPTDSSLLWGSWRVMVRMLHRAHKRRPLPGVTK